MLRSRFLWKLYAGYVILIVASTAIVGVLTAQSIERDTLEETQESLEARATLLRESALSSLEGSPDPELQERIRSLGSEIETRLTIIGEEGVVIADSDEDPATMDDHSNRPEVLAAKAQGLGSAIRFSNTLETRMMYVALPTYSEERLVGFVRVSLPLSSIDERLGHLRGVVALGAGAAAIGALILGFFMARTFAAPLLSMTAVAESMASGDYGQKLSVTGKDEVGKLADAFNHMAQSLQERMQTITTDRNKLLAILAGMVEGVVAVDEEERVVHINAVAAGILHTDAEAAVGRKVWEISRVPAVCEALSATLGNGQDIRRELRLVARPRDQVVEMHASPLRDGEGQLVGAVVVLHDITELGRLEAVRRDFIGNVSHELKTPITAIRGLVETMIDDREMDQEIRDRFLGRVSEQSQRLSTLVTDLLALSRLESEGAPLERSLVDLRDVVATAARGLLPGAEELGVVVEVESPDSPLYIRGDEEILRQLASNLLDNALKYTPAGGRVWLRLREDRTLAVLEVEDTGIGIEPEHQARLFERFYRVDKARSRELGGTGLGLSIVKHVALVHGGDVSVESAPGKGSTFRVALPLST